MSGLYTRLQQVWQPKEEAPLLLWRGRPVTFGAFASMVNRIQHLLPEGDGAVGICLSHSPWLIAAVFACLKAGRAYVPAESFLPAERKRFMFADGGADYVLTEEKIAQAQDDSPLPDVGQMADAAYILYTSGSTGRPKGVVITQANIWHYVQAFQKEFHLGPEDVMLQNSVCSFDIFTEEVFCSLLNGAALAIAGEEDKQDMDHLVRFIEANRVSVVDGFPYFVSGFNGLERLPQSIRLFISGGDILRHCQIDHLQGKARIYNTYGPSEATVCCTYHDCSECGPCADGSFPIGHPIDGVQIRIVDEEGKDAASGELLIGGAGVGAGYASFVSDAFFTDADGVRWYRSGDLGCRDADGSLVFLGRIDDQVMIDGRRVEPAESENILAEQAGVDAVCVVSREDENQMPVLAAFYEGEAEPEDLRRVLEMYLADYMVPEYIFQVEKIPVLVNGKPDRQALKERMRGLVHHAH